MRHIFLLYSFILFFPAFPQSFPQWTIDIYTGCVLYPSDEPSTGFPEPTNSWAKQLIAAIKTGDHQAFLESLHAATYHKPGHSPMISSQRELFHILFNRPLGDKTTIFDIAQKSPSTHIQEDLNFLFVMKKNISQTVEILKKINDQQLTDCLDKKNLIADELSTAIVHLSNIRQLSRNGF